MKIASGGQTVEWEASEWSFPFSFVLEFVGKILVESLAADLKVIETTKLWRVL